MLVGNHFKQVILTTELLSFSKSGFKKCLMPSIAPGKVTPRISRINKTTYGNTAVNQTT